MSCLNGYDRFYAWEGGVDPMYEDEVLFEEDELRLYYELPEFCYDTEYIIDELTKVLEDGQRYWSDDSTEEYRERIVKENEYKERLCEDYVNEHPEYWEEFEEYMMKGE